MTPDLEPFDNFVDEEEWRAQEAARSEVAATDPRILDYQRLEHALLAAPRYELPADFARRVADAVEHQDYALDVFERRVLIALSIGFLTVLTVLGITSLATTRSTSLSSAAWLIALIACGLVLNAMTPSGTLPRRKNFLLS